MPIRVESAGIERARQTLETADLVVVLVDVSQPASADDRAILAVHRSAIVVAHKCDLPMYEGTDRWQIERNWLVDGPAWNDGAMPTALGGHVPQCMPTPSRGDATEPVDSGRSCHSFLPVSSKSGAGVGAGRRDFAATRPPRPAARLVNPAHRTTCRAFLKAALAAAERADTAGLVRSLEDLMAGRTIRLTPRIDSLGKSDCGAGHFVARPQPDVEQEAQRDGRGDQARAAVTDQWQRDSGDGHQADGHPGVVDDRLRGDQRDHADGQQPSERLAACVRRSAVRRRTGPGRAATSCTSRSSRIVRRPGNRQNRSAMRAGGKPADRRSSRH